MSYTFEDEQFSMDETEGAPVTSRDRGPVTSKVAT